MEYRGTQMIGVTASVEVKVLMRKWMIALERAKSGLAETRGQLLTLDHNSHERSKKHFTLRGRTRRAKHEFDGKNHLQKRSPADWTRLKPRNKKLESEDTFETRRLKASRFQNYYLGAHNRAERERLEAPDAPLAEKALYEDLRAAYNLHRRETKKQRKSDLPPRPDPSQYTPQEVKTLHEMHKSFRRSYHTSTQGKIQLTRLTEALSKLKNELEKRTNRKGTLEELADWAGYDKNDARFKMLADFEKRHSAFKEYLRWKDWDQGRRAGEYSFEEKVALDEHRVGYKIWRNEFKGASRKSIRERLEAEGDTTREGRRYQGAKASYSAYMKVIKAHRRQRESIEIKVDTRYVEDVRRMETLREPANEFMREYTGQKNEAKRQKLDAGIGTKAELRRYQNLKAAAAELNKIYLKIRRRLKEDIGASDSGPTPDEGERGQVSLDLAGKGRPRWNVRLLDLLDQTLNEKSKSEDESTVHEALEARKDEEGDSGLALKSDANINKAAGAPGDAGRRALEKIAGAFMAALQGGARVPNRSPQPGSFFQAAARAGL